MAWIPIIKDINQFEILKHNNEFIFIFYGDLNNPRSKIFAEGYYHFPEYKFVLSENPILGKNYNLTKNNIYVF